MKINTWKIVLYKFTNQINIILKWFFKKINPTSKEIWELQYLKGNWDGLKNIEQLGNYSIIIGYINELKKGGSILDVGCGEGILFERIDKNYYSQYIGIDISQNAIKKASQKKNDKADFFAINALDYNPKNNFDIIIYNEILYYFSKNEIKQMIEKFNSFLKEEGIIIISMFLNDENETLWNLLRSFLILQDEIKITNRHGVSWRCKVFRKMK